MVNFGLNSASILGIFLAVAGAGLYFMRTIRPELSRDHDIFFAAVGLVCGAILLWSGWRLDPILQLSQFLLTGSAIFFAFEAIRLRGIATEQARRSTPIVDDERPVSRVYREAKLDDRELYDDPYATRRLKGTRDPRPTRRSEYEAEERRPSSRSKRDRASDAYEDRTSKPRRSRPAPPPLERYGNTYEEWEASSDSYEEPPTPPSRSRRPRPEPEADIPPTRPSRRRRPRPADVEATPVDYVDYQPIEDIEDPRDVADRYGTPYDDSEDDDAYAEETVRERDRYPEEGNDPYDDEEDLSEGDRGRPSSFDY
jgi:hypothetical protein